MGCNWLNRSDQGYLINYNTLLRIDKWNSNNSGLETLNKQTEIKHIDNYTKLTQVRGTS